LSAPVNLFISEYIPANDTTGNKNTTGNKIIGALMADAARGAQVYLLADGCASQQVGESVKRKLQGSGVYYYKKQALLLWQAYGNRNLPAK